MKTFMVIIGLGIMSVFMAWEANPSPRSFSACLPLFPGGAIPTPQSTTILDLCKTANGRPIFAIRFDTVRKTPNWTAHRLSVAQKAKIESAPAYAHRKDFFAPDPDVTEALQAQEKNYQNTHFNKGHLVRATDMNWNKAAYRTTYLMTNMAPQRGALNSGPWLGMEKAFQKLVTSKNTALWSISGVYGTHTEMPTLKDNPENATVPKCFYKIIVAQVPREDGRKTYKTLSALFVNDNHERKQKRWSNAVTTLARIEQRTGIDFFQGLEVETNFDAAYWGVPMPDTPGDCE